MAPRELKMAWQFETYGLTFPASEMEAGLMTKMSACLNVYRAVHEHNVFVYNMQKTDVEFRKKFPELALICTTIKNLRERLNGQ
jgi:hypothetical protein